MINAVEIKDNSMACEQKSFAVSSSCKKITSGKSDRRPKRRYENTGKILINKREMIAMLENGQSRCAVARYFGVTVTAVTKSLQRMTA